MSKNVELQQITNGGQRRAENKKRHRLSVLCQRRPMGWLIFSPMCWLKKKEPHTWKVRNCSKIKIKCEKKLLFFQANANGESYLMRTNGRRRVERLLRCLARALQGKHIMRGMFFKERATPGKSSAAQVPAYFPASSISIFCNVFWGR